MYVEIDGCRVCGNQNLISVISLSDQYISGVFPSTRNHLDTLTKGPLELVKCHGDDSCGLLQLRQSYDLSEMYGDNYGYRSSLNITMVDHLRKKVRQIRNMVTLNEGDCVVDIGSNDSTLLRAYPQMGLDLVGFDPAGDKFRKYYPSHIKLIPDFFSAQALRGQRAKVVTSIAVFYDLEDPVRFMQDVYDVLTDDGVWVTEQSYMPTMLRNRSYDTVCHEHLEYYGLRQIKWMADQVGFRICDVKFNDVNGGSFSVTMAKRTAAYSRTIDIDRIISEEPGTSLDPYFAFTTAVEQSKQGLRSFVANVRSTSKRIYALGASTKGNTILQHCGFTEDDIPFVGEVNSDKFGCFTPGTRIPIIPEDEVLAMEPDYLLVLPWHFRNFFADNPKYTNARLVFPLPVLDVLN